MKRLLFTALLLALPMLSIAKKPPPHLDDIETRSAEGSATPGKATVYLLRGRSKAGLMMKHIVFVDGRRMGSMRRMNFLAIPVDPGTHALRIDCPSICSVPDIEVIADFKADRTYYFLNDPLMGQQPYGFDFTNEFGQLDKQEAETELRDYEPGEREDEQAQ